MSKHCKAFRKYIRSYDMFGHAIAMNFNKKGNNHKTQIGAFFSIFIQLFIHIYIAITFKQLLWKDANTNSTISSVQDIKSLGKVYYEESGHRVFYTMKKQISKKALKIGDGMTKYLDIYFSQVENDWETVPGKNTQTIERYGIRRCTAEDFPFAREADKIFKQWYGFDLICPDVPSTKSLYM